MVAETGLSHGPLDASPPDRMRNTEEEGKIEWRKGVSMAEETKTDVAATEEPAKDAKKAKNGKKKWPIVVGVVAHRGWMRRSGRGSCRGGFFRLARAAELLQCHLPYADGRICRELHRRLS